MIAVTVGKRKLKILLNADESISLFQNSSYFSCAEPETKRILRKILNTAIAHTDFILDTNRLFVEIYPCSLGGVAIYFTKAPYTGKYRLNPNYEYKCSLSFSDFESVRILCRELINRCEDRFTSSLYKYNNEYILIIGSKGKNRLPFPLITEFADSICCKNIAAEAVSEHGNSIIKENAIEALSKA